MNLPRRALSLAAIAALSLALVPTPALATAIGGCAPGDRAATEYVRRARRQSRERRTPASLMPIFRRGLRAGHRPTSL